MSSLNKVMIIGRLGQDPELRYTQSNTAVATLSVATTEKFKDKDGQSNEKTEWHKVVLWGKLAEVAKEYLAKGRMVYIEGSLKTREWEDKEGVKRYTTEINGSQMVMLGGNPEKGSGGPAQPPSEKPRPKPSPAKQMEIGDNFEDMDDDLPF